MENRTLTLTALAGIPLVGPGDDLGIMLEKSLGENNITLTDGDVLVLAQKIVSKAEGRLVDLADVHPTPEAEELALESEKDPRLVQVILGESKQILRCRRGLIIVEHNRGFVCANAGIDRSNVAAGADEIVLLLPEDPDLSARNLRGFFQDSQGVEIGVLIIDSHGRAWRNGIVGISIGFAGLPGIVDLRGGEDLFGYQLQVTQVAAVDELAAGASLIMGQAAEGFPAVHVRGFPYPGREGKFSELPRDEEADLFR